MGSPISIVDDDEPARHSMRLLLEIAGLAVKDYATAEHFLCDDVSGTACVVADVQMPKMDGFALQHEISRRRADLPIVMISGFGRVELAVRAMKAGAVDFLEKPIDADVFVAAVRRAVSLGERFRIRTAESRNARRLLAQLTPRERHVLAQLVAGHSNREAAANLGISPRTVEVYRAQVMDKLRANSLSDIVRLSMAADRAPSMAA